MIFHLTVKLSVQSRHDAMHGKVLEKLKHEIICCHHAENQNREFIWKDLL